jgi:hypothetical protein
MGRRSGGADPFSSARAANASEQATRADSKVLDDRILIRCTCLDQHGAVVEKI